MAVLNELAQTNRRNQITSSVSTPTGGVGQAGYKQTKIVDNTPSLINDIEKLGGGLIKQHQQASEYAGAVVGSDNYNQFYEQKKNLEEEFSKIPNPKSTDVAELKNKITALYEAHKLNAVFEDNELANEQVKKKYTEPALKELKQAQVSLTQMQTKLFINEENARISSDIYSTDGRADLEVARKDGANIGTPPEKINIIFADAMNKAVGDKYDLKGNRLPIYNEDGTINKTLYKEAFNKEYAGRVVINDDLTVVATELDPVATNKILKYWNTLVHEKTNRDSPQALVAKLNTSSIGDGSQEIMIAYEKNDKQIKSLQSAEARGIGKRTNSEIVASTQKQALLLEQYRTARYYESSFNNIADNASESSAGEFLSDSLISYSYTHPQTGDVITNTEVVSKDEKQRIIKNAVGNIDNDELLSPTRTPKEKRLAIKRLHNVQALTGIKSKVVTKWNSEFVSSGKVGGKGIYEQAEVFNGIVDMQLDPKLKMNTWINRPTAIAIQNEYKERLAKLDSIEDPKERSKLEEQFEKEMATIVNVSMLNSKAVKNSDPEYKMISKAVSDYEQSTGYYTKYGVTPTTRATRKQIVDNIVADKKGSIENLSEDQQVELVKSWMNEHTITLRDTLELDGITILKPTGLSDASPDNVRERIMFDAKKAVKAKKYAEGIEFDKQAHLQVNSTYDPKTKQQAVTVVIRNKNTGEIIDILVYNDMNVLVGGVLDNEKTKPKTKRKYR